jgi:hypothetical protein
MSPARNHISYLQGLVTSPIPTSKYMAYGGDHSVRIPRTEIGKKIRTADRFRIRRDRDRDRAVGRF